MCNRIFPKKAAKISSQLSLSSSNQKIRRRPGVDYGQDRSKPVEVSGSCRALLDGVDRALFRAFLATERTKKSVFFSFPLARAWQLFALHSLPT
jgi:hypothetical protein